MRELVRSAWQAASYAAWLEPSSGSEPLHRPPAKGTQMSRIAAGEIVLFRGLRALYSVSGAMPITRGWRCGCGL